MLKFFEEDHRYESFLDPNRKYTSLTTVLEHYHENFEDTAEFWKQYKVVQYLTESLEKKINKFDETLNELIKSCCEFSTKEKYLFTLEEGKSYLKFAFANKHFEGVPFTVEQETIIQSCIEIVTNFWNSKTEKACDDGSEFHLGQEKIQYEIYKGKKYHLQEWVWDQNKRLFNFEPGCMYNEIRLCSDEHGISGSCDRVQLPEENLLIIRDWKTNGEINTVGYRGKTYFYPVSQYPDCELGKYSLQLNGYAFMLSKLGYQISELRFEHFKRKPGGGFEDTPVVYPVKVDLEAAERMFDHFAMSQSLKL